jgi:hypothetical protein
VSCTRPPADVVARCTSANAPKVTDSNSGTPRVLTWVEIRTRCATVNMANNQPVPLPDIENGHLSF